ncbi:MAG TPA: hypothetical protein VM737_04880 [Gemmatimonadota bacterium]|nr:hypothetical protein [Gemmatimonadota bacterium]
MSPSRRPEPDPPDAGPPDAGPPDASPGITCPHCGSSDVELESAFGSSLMTGQYYCRGCRTVFERIKWEDDDPGDWLDRTDRA